jgi:hypothetical protein
MKRLPWPDFKLHGPAMGAHQRGKRGGGSSRGRGEATAGYGEEERREGWHEVLLGEEAQSLCCFVSSRCSCKLLA